jgi:hypothetical protein
MTRLAEGLALHLALFQSGQSIQPVTSRVIRGASILKRLIDIAVMPVQVS